MCILAFVTRYCERFPLVLISNRDEFLARATSALTLDPATGLLWAVDQKGGGSWMGIEVHSGRFAILTNCRRAPAAPLTCGTVEEPLRVPAMAPMCSADTASDATPHAAWSAGPWRGAAPLAHICACTTVVPVSALPDTEVATSKPIGAAEGATVDASSSASPGQTRAVTLAYDPPTSRGTIVKKFLMTGCLSGDAADDDESSLRQDAPDRPERRTSPLPVDATAAVADIPPTRVLHSPFYAGYCLLSCDNLRGGDGHHEADPRARDSADHAAPSLYPQLSYTSNRFGAEYRVPLPHRHVHTLQNSFLDNVEGEPISKRLKQLFSDALERVIDPLAAGGLSDPGGGASSSSAAVVRRIATELADSCLCDRYRFDLPHMAKSSSPAEAAALHAQLCAGDPLLGFTEKELQLFFGGTENDGDGSRKAPAGAASPHSPSLRFTDGAAARREAYLQSTIYKPPRFGYGTRVQSIVLVERVAATASLPAALSLSSPSPIGGPGAWRGPPQANSDATTTVIYFCQREMTWDAALEQPVGAPWVIYRVTQDGGCVCEGAEG